LLFLSQGDRLPGHAARVTDSLFSYRVTLSLFIHNPTYKRLTGPTPRASVSERQAPLSAVP
jgi:hypothetical protein